MKVIPKQLIVVFIFSLLLILAAWMTERMPHTSGDVRSLFPTSSAALDAFKQTNQAFGNVVNDIVVVSTGNELTTEKREQILNLDDELSLLDGVVKVISPLTAFSKTLVSPIQLRSTQEPTARFLIQIDGKLDDFQRVKLNSQITDVLQSYQSLQPARTGAFFISESVTNVLKRETSRRTPITILALLFVSTLILRQFQIALAVLIAPGLSVLWTVFGASLCNLPLGPVSQLVPPFILAVGSSYSIHVATRLLSAEKEASSKIERELRKAISIAAITTIIGICSLFIMNIRAIGEFALLGSVGVGLAASFSLMITPMFVRHRRNRLLELPNVFMRPIQHPLPFLVILGITIFASFGVPKILVHTDPLMFMPQSSWERTQIDTVLKSFPGNRILSVMFTPSKGALKDGEFSAIDTIAREVLGFDNVFSVVSDGQFKKIGTLKKSFSMIETESFTSAPEDITLANAQATRFLVETNLEGAQLLALKDSIAELTKNRLAEMNLADDLIFHVSGLELLIAEQTSVIVKGIIGSLLFTLLIVAIILFCFFRNPYLVMIGLVPNIVPVTVVLGTIGWIYKDINLGASLVGAAALSIAVDNTFHFMISWREEIKRQLHHKQEEPSATEHTISQCFPSFFTTSIVLTTGFLVMALSDVLPVQQFGLLLATTLVVGLMADTVVLPYLTFRFECSSAFESFRKKC